MSWHTLNHAYICLTNLNIRDLKDLGPGHFLRIRQWGGGHLQKGTILYRVWRNDRWLVGNKKFGVVSHGAGGGGVWRYSPPENFCIFLPL